MLVVDDVNYESPDDKVCEWNFVEDVLVLLPGNNRICTKAPADEAGDDTYGILIIETP